MDPQIRGAQQQCRHVGVTADSALDTTLDTCSRSQHAATQFTLAVNHTMTIQPRFAITNEVAAHGSIDALEHIDIQVMGRFYVDIVRISL
jgi:hypothetical protein